MNRERQARLDGAGAPGDGGSAVAGSNSQLFAAFASPGVPLASRCFSANRRRFKSALVMFYLIPSDGSFWDDAFELNIWRYKSSP